MPHRNDDDHGGGLGWRISRRADRLRKLHEFGRAFGLTEDAKYPTPDEAERDPERDHHDGPRA